MPKFVVRPETEAWRTLGAQLDRAGSLVRGPEVNLNELGKALASIARAALDVFAEAGLPSVRMEAAAKALDLRTKKSELEQFVRGDP